MAEELLLPGGSSETEDFYIGPERALRVDTSNDELRLHDGSKVGGFRFLNRDANDQRYQAKQAELDGISFSPQQRGFLTRVGPATYRLRELTVNTASLHITHPLGLMGNPLIKLADTITSNHAFSGDITFLESVLFLGGLEGDLTGDTFGTHTGPVIGNVTGNVTGNLTGDSTGNHTGGLNTVGAVVEMDDEQIQYDWLSAEIKALWVNRGLPVGAIIMWSGDANDIPTSFAICDGTNSTPDLRDRFIIASGSTFDPHESGGSSTHTHTGSSDASGAHAHTGACEGHSLTVAELPSHQHSNGATDEIQASQVFNHGTIAASPTSGDSIDNNGSTGDWEGLTGFTGGGDAHTHTITLDAGGAHTHPLSVDNASSLPPYYSLCFIMKVL